MLLTDKERAEFLVHGETAPRQLVYRVAIAQHQQDLKDFIEWGEELCMTHYGPSLYIGRRQCEECWKTFKELPEEHE